MLKNKTEDDLRGRKDNNAKLTFSLFDTKKMTAKAIYDFLTARSEKDEKAQHEESDVTPKSNKT